MKVISTNIAKPVTFIWNGKNEQTGIYKYPVSEPILLTKESVAKDTISNRKVHGGVHKACYLYSADHYPEWQKLYPNLDWKWGMFGENLTVKCLDESQLRIGDIFKIGDALVQISQPREPCYKLGVRFGTQGILKQFIEHGFPGTYVRVLEEGKITVGDEFKLIKKSENPLTVKQFYELLYAKEKNAEILQMALSNTALSEYKRARIKKWL